MILTYKIKHLKSFSQELAQAREVAEYALKTKSRSSKDVKHIGLKSTIANQILKKYSSDKKLKRIHRVNLVIPSQGIKVNKEERVLSIPCVKLTLKYYFPDNFEKINQIECNKEYAYVSITLPEVAELKAESFIGVDLNTTGHCAVVGNPASGKVLKLGKSSLYIHKKYSQLRRNFQKQNKLKKLKQVKDREKRITKDLLHKVSRKIVKYAQEEKAGIKLEKLTGIRGRAKVARSFTYFLHSWSFYQISKMIGYKAKLLGIPVVYIDPRYTSQECSRCRKIGNRNGKIFKCSSCEHVDHADVNASFNIALRH
jgi:putative transposase